MSRFFELFFAIFILFVVIIPMIIIAITVKISSKGPIIHFSKRIGKDNKIFLMPKFRTMKLNTPQIDTNNFKNSESYVTLFGSYLRKYSLDELPQIFCIINNTMAFIGPRPALYNQDDLITLRNKYLINKIKPGITGWAQINGRDNLTIEKKVELEAYYLNNKSLSIILEILYKTILKVFLHSDIKH